MIKNIHLNSKGLIFLIAFTLFINILLMVVSILPDHDPTLYGNLAKHIALFNDWINLTFNNIDWLDKPHFPFWITALSFKLLGISSLTYLIPGFIFHLLGAYYTYRLASHLYNHQIGLLSVLIYISSAHILISTIDLKAETYLLGEIMPACYYGLLYHENSGFKINYLLLGTFFTALAMMTKGIFVLVTITGGLGCLWIYNLVLEYKSNSSLRIFARIKLKWIAAFILSFIFIAPELISLYLQFDLHPEKIIFNKTGVSGIRWFFWDSQIGRFFNTGEITRKSDSWHYLFFIYTFLWCYLPWSATFLAALSRIATHFKQEGVQQRRAYIFLLGSFFPTFIMFSLSSFQLEHYINIIIPFAAILSANWICTVIEAPSLSQSSKLVLFSLIVFAVGITLCVFVADLVLLAHIPWIFFILILVVLSAFLVLTKQSFIFKSIVYPILAINTVFTFHMLLNRSIYLEYDAGYKIAQYLTHQPILPVFNYQINSWTLSFHTPNQLPILESTPTQRSQAAPYYLVIKKHDLPAVQLHIGNYQILMETAGINFLTRPFSVIGKLWLSDKANSEVNHYLLIRSDRTV